MIVKYSATLEEPTRFIGYIITENGQELIVPINNGNADYRRIKKWEAEGNIVSEPFSPEELSEYQIKKINLDAVNMISAAIEAEITNYNTQNDIALASVHNAESYSRVSGYTHQEFCSQVWLWSVSLWEHMRAWQGELVTLPTQEEIQTKIDELPFTLVL